MLRAWRGFGQPLPPARGADRHGSGGAGDGAPSPEERAVRPLFDDADPSHEPQAAERAPDGQPADDAEMGERIATTASDSNGFYGFEIDPGAEYFLQFDLPSVYQFTEQNIGDEDHDSDVDPASGQTPVFQPSISASSWDAGLIIRETPTATPSPVPRRETSMSRRRR